MKFYKPKFWDKRNHVSLFSILLMPLSLIVILKNYYANNYEYYEKVYTNKKFQF